MNFKKYGVNLSCSAWREVRVLCEVSSFCKLTYGFGSEIARHHFIKYLNAIKPYSLMAMLVHCRLDTVLHEMLGGA